MGSPSDDFSFNLNLLYVGSFPENMGGGKYSFSYALVRPDGTWSFLKKLSEIVDIEKIEEKKNEIERVDIASAVQHIKSVINPDLALVHFVCLKGITTYRLDIFMSIRHILLEETVGSKQVTILDPKDFAVIVKSQNNIDCN